MSKTYSINTVATFNGTNGANPFGSLISDGGGNLFGTTYDGGVNGDGTVFEIPKSGSGYGTLQTVATFTGNNGAHSNGSLIADGGGNLLGTTAGGGANGDGTVFEIPKSGSGYGTLQTVATFTGNNGANPFGSLIADGGGNLFGTTYDGGDANGDGTVFEIPKSGSGYGNLQTVATFSGTDGSRPRSSLFVDGAGNLLGTTSGGGANGDGTVFEIPKSGSSYGTLQTVATFTGNNGANPFGSLIADGGGNLFGTTSSGGVNGDGTVFEIPKSGSSYGTLQTVTTFTGSNGAHPNSSLFVDGAGNLLGTTLGGGANGDGTVFEIPKSGSSYGTLQTVATFTGNNGANPYASLFADGEGDLFGTTYSGGANNQGTVFELVDDTLTVTASGGTTAFTAGPTPVVIDPALSITKADSADLTGATVQIINGKSGDEFGNGTAVLGSSGTFTSAGNVQLSYTYDPSTYTLTISGSDTATDYQTLLRGLSYASNLIVPDTTTRKIDFTATSGFLTSDPAEKDVTVADANQTPPAPGGGPSGPSTTPSSGPDLLTGTAGPDTIAGLGGDDTINGVSGNDLILGNQGNDTISDGDGNSTILGGMGNDGIAVGNGANLLLGGEGADTIQAGNGGDTIVGGTGNAAIDSLDGADLITSGSGNDLILGNGGDDTIGAGGGNDTVAGGFGNDVILGNQGDDIVLGNQGNDTLFGGYGNDTLVGGQGNDVLYGNQGDDVLYGNEGLNTFVFNPGDTDFKPGTSTGDTIMDFATGTSRIDFAAGPAGTSSNFGATSTTSTDFAAIQALAQTLINGGDAYAFVADGTDGFLFTTGGSGTTITDAVKLAGAGTAGAVKYTDIAHGALG